MLAGLNRLLELKFGHGPELVLCKTYDFLVDQRQRNVARVLYRALEYLL